jgi:hypothetical protein
VSTCSGSFSSPGLLAGTYNGSVDISGVCFQNGAPALVEGNLVLTPGSALDATFALDDKAHNGSRTSLTVTGDVIVDAGATLFLGCEPNFAACSDSSTLTSEDAVVGSVTATDALGVVIHATRIGGGVSQSGGGGGVTCSPTGVFASFQSPVYSDYEDLTIGGGLSITRLGTCWLGAIRNKIGGSFTDSGNVMADPDANEMMDNTVGNNLSCDSNSPAVHYGDSGSAPNVVSGTASGECAFDVTSFNADWYFPGLVPSPNPSRKESVTLPVSLPPDPSVGMARTTDGRGYWLADASGGVFHFGDAAERGSHSGTLAFPVRGLAATPDGGGYWLATSDGPVLHFGDAGALGPSGLPSGYPVAGVARTAAGNGFWLATANGGVYPYGNATSHGSAAGTPLSAAVVGIAPTPDGKGYWLVTSDGGVFSFGDARFYGSEGGKHLNAPVVGIAPTADGHGYWLVASDGGVFSFGDARFHGSEGGAHLTEPVAGICTTGDGGGYWLFAGDGGIFSFGDAHFYGSKG